MRSRGIGIVTALVCTLVAIESVEGCGGDSFSPAPEEARSGGGTTTDGGSEGGGEGGTSPSGGLAGSGGRAGAASGGDESGGQGDGGAGGEPSCSDGMACPEGRYCGAQGVCQLCSDIVSLDDPGAARFGAPEPLSVINESAGDWMLRTPRAFGSTGALLYVRDFFGGEIWLTGDLENDIGAPLPSPINEPDFLEGSPLWLTRDDGIFASLNFVFNRATDGVSANEFYGVALEANGTASNLRRLPAPFNPTQPLTESGYQMAVSHDRAWWMVNRDLMLAIQFLTAPLEQVGPPSVVPLPYSENCDIQEFDLGAWVTPDGKLLFVNAHERTADCTPLSGEPMDIVMLKLNEAGQALGTAVPVSGVSHPESTEIDPSLSPDMCTIYFVTPVMDKLRLMRAKREG